LPVVINDDRQVHLALAVAELVDANATQAHEPVRVEPVGHDALDDVSHRSPTEPQQLRDCRLVRELRQVGGHLLEVRGEATAELGPRHPLDTHATLGAVHPAHRVLQPDDDRAPGQRSPAPWLSEPVVARRLAVTPTAARSPPLRTHRDHQVAFLEPERHHHEGDDRKQPPQ